MRLIDRLRFWLKNQKILAWLPPAVVLVIFPVAIWAAWRENGIGFTLYQEIIRLGQMLLPLLSVVWIIFGLRTLFEGDGAELVYRRVRNIYLLDTTMLFLLYQLMAVLVFTVFQLLWFETMYLEYLRVLCLCLFSHGLVVFLMKLIAAPLITLLVHVLYNSMNIMLGMTTDCFPFKFQVNQILKPHQLIPYLPFALAGLGLMLLSWALPFRLRRVD